MAASSIKNPSVEVCAMPYPFQGILQGGQTIILPYTPAQLAALCTSLPEALIIQDLGDYSGPNDEAAFGPTSADGGAFSDVVVTTDDAVTNAVTRGLTLSHTTTGTAAAGIGAGALLRAESNAGTLRSAGSFDAIHTTVTDGAEVSALVLSSGIAGSLLEVARLATVVSAVNGLAVTGSATGEPVQLGVRGSDTDITVALVPKGAGGAMLLAGSGDNAFGLTTAGVRVDSGSDTGATPTVSRNSGIVRVQSGNTSVTVVNALCTTDSKIFAQIRNTTTNAVSILRVVPGSATFDVVLSGDPGASHADIAFFMLQPDA